jgi:hypothetical protein
MGRGSEQRMARRVPARVNLRQSATRARFWWEFFFASKKMFDRFGEVDLTIP